MYPSSTIFNRDQIFWGIKGYWAQTTSSAVHVGVVEVAIRIHKEHPSITVIPVTQIFLNVLDIPQSV